MLMKRFLIGVLLFILLGAALLLTAPRPAPKKSANNPRLTNRDMSNILRDPRHFVGRRIDLNGQVAQDPQYDRSGTHVQIFVVFERVNTYIIGDYSATLEVTQGDFINARGLVTDTFKGVTDDGHKLETVRVRVDKVRSTTPENALAPALKTWTPGLTEVDHNVSVSLDRVEFAATETRFYLKIRNGASEPIVTHLYNSEATQARRRYGLQPNPIAGYKEMPVDLASGVDETGVLVFPVMTAGKPLKLSLGLSGSGWEGRVEFKPKPGR